MLYAVVQMKANFENKAEMGLAVKISKD